MSAFVATSKLGQFRWVIGFIFLIPFFFSWNHGCRSHTNISCQAIVDCFQTIQSQATRKPARPMVYLPAGGIALWCLFQKVYPSADNPIPAHSILGYGAVAAPCFVSFYHVNMKLWYWHLAVFQIGNQGTQHPLTSVSQFWPGFNQKWRRST